jgi:hypothetical protein
MKQIRIKQYKPQILTEKVSVRAKSSSQHFTQLISNVMSLSHTAHFSSKAMYHVV